MLQIKKELCRGCGLCAQSCPQGAIFPLWGKAEIDQNKCIYCYQCLEVCPTGAIGERAEVSTEALKAMVTNLKQRAEYVIDRIEASKL